MTSTGPTQERAIELGLGESPSLAVAFTQQEPEYRKNQIKMLAEFLQGLSPNSFEPKWDGETTESNPRAHLLRRQGASARSEMQVINSPVLPIRVSSREHIEYDVR